MNDTAALQDPTLGDGDEDPPEISIDSEPEDGTNVRIFMPRIPAPAESSTRIKN